MKVLIYHSSSFTNPHFGLLMDETEKYLREGHEVYFVTCHGAASMCIVNNLAHKSKCRVCKMGINKYLNKLSKGINKIDLSKYVEQNHATIKYDYHSIDDLKHIEYKNTKIGYAVMSFYITLTRNLNPAIDDKFTHYIDRALESATLLTDAYTKVLEEVNPDRVILFNGRLFESRPMLDYSVEKGYETYCYEVTGGYEEDFYKIIFKNVMPHNVDYNLQMVRDRWNDTAIPQEEKLAIGKSFYENRRGGKPAGDKIYIKNQKAGELPTDWNPSKRNFAIFNSSEDEFASIGDEFDRLKFFPNQLEGIKKVLSLCMQDENIHVYLRVHPNLIGIPYHYHQDLYKLPEEFSNVTVIPADAKVSSYTLMDKVEKVVVFGSTMGLEATYWEKPVILLGAAFYTPLDMCYKPKSEDDLKNLLFSILEPKGKQEAIEFGYSTMYRDQQAKHDYIDFNQTEWTFRGITYELPNYQTLFGSKKLYALYIAFLKRLFGLFDSNYFENVPEKENLE